MTAADDDVVPLMFPERSLTDERFLPSDAVVGFGVTDVVFGSGVGGFTGEVPAAEFFGGFIKEDSAVDLNHPLFPREVLLDERIFGMLGRLVDVTVKVSFSSDEKIVEEELRVIGKGDRLIRKEES